MYPDELVKYILKKFFSEGHLSSSGKYWVVIHLDGLLPPAVARATTVNVEHDPADEKEAEYFWCRVEEVIKPTGVRIYTEETGAQCTGDESGLPLLIAEKHLFNSSELKSVWALGVP